MREVVCYPETINTTLLWRTLFNTWIVQTWVPESGRHGSTSHGPLPQRSLLRCNWQEWASLAEAGDYLLSHDMDSEEHPRQQVAGTCQNLHLCKRVLYRNNSHKIELIWIPKMSAIESHTRLFFFRISQWPRQSPLTRTQISRRSHFLNSSTSFD